MSEGWRVQRNHARRRAQFLRDWRNPLPALVQTGPDENVFRSDGRQGETRGNAGLVRTVHTVRSFPSKTLLRAEHAERVASPTIAEGDVSHMDTLNGLDCVDRLDGGSICAGFLGPVAPPPHEPFGPQLRPWTDDRGWIADIVRAAPGDERMAVLFWWVIAAGGWIEGTTAKLPILPGRMARVRAAPHAEAAPDRSLRNQ